MRLNVTPRLAALNDAYRWAADAKAGSDLAVEPLRASDSQHLIRRQLRVSERAPPFGKAITEIVTTVTKKKVIQVDAPPIIAAVQNANIRGERANTKLPCYAVGSEAFSGGVIPKFTIPAVVNSRCPGPTVTAFLNLGPE